MNMINRKLKILNKFCYFNSKRFKSTSNNNNNSLSENTLKTDNNQNVFKKLIFSGIQPTSIPHIGNYFGAIKQWVDLQRDNENVIISIVDLHAITIPKESLILSDYILKCAASLIACGIDPNKTILYQQSTVPLHGQLSWILGCYLTMTQLGHMHQFKWKSNALSEVPLGLYCYPVLQTADILLYKATHVPIGEDQKQHLELCRTIAKKFNNYHKTDFFPVPQIIHSECKRMLSLRDPKKKMSKSDADQRSRIELVDTPELISHKIKKAVTDSTSSVTYDPDKRPGVANLIDIHAACTGKLAEEIVEDCYLKALDTGEYKKEVAETLIQTLKPIRNEYMRLVHDKAHLNKLLKIGTDRATQIATETYEGLTKIVGFKF